MSNWPALLCDLQQFDWRVGCRTIVSGLANYIPLEEMQGRMCTVLCAVHSFL